MKLHWTKRIAYTVGVEELAETHGAYWLIDAIASHLMYSHVAGESFQVWNLEVKGTAATLSMTDGNGDTAIVTQHIEYTDFPPPGCELWLVLGEVWVLMTPGEY